jgi:VanZ family protein
MIGIPLKTRIAVFRFWLATAIVLISWLAVTPREIPVASGLNDKIGHILAFFVLMGLAGVSFPEPGNHLTAPALLLVYGVVIEVIQHFLPWRMFSLLDVAADVLGIGCGLIAWHFLKKTQHSRLSQNS